MSAPALLNFFLEITGRRPDGFHELETVMHPVPVCDTLEFVTAARGLELTGSDPALPMDASNLVHRAATAYLQAAGIRDGSPSHASRRPSHGVSSHWRQLLQSQNGPSAAHLRHGVLQVAAARMSREIRYVL